MRHLKLNKNIIELNIYDMLKFYFRNCDDYSIDYVYSEFDSSKFVHLIEDIYGLSYDTTCKIADYILENMTDNLGYLDRKIITLVRLYPFPEMMVSPRHKNKWYRFLKGYDEKIKTKKELK